MKAWSLSDIISATAASVAVLGFLVVIWQVRIATAQLEQAQLHQRAQLLSDLHDRAVNSRDNAEIFQRIEYDELKYDEAFHNSEDQRKLAQLLSFLELVARLEGMGLLEFSDVRELFGYFMVQVYRSRVVTDYVAMLERRADTLGLPSDITFPRFRMLAKRIVEMTASEGKSGPPRGSR